MKSASLLLACLAVLALGDPTYWQATIPNNNPGNPTPREFHTLTNIPGTSFNVLFGGQAFNQTDEALGDTWVLDTGAALWKLMNPAVAPQARCQAVAGATSDEVILFGGQNLVSPRTFFSDVWRYNLTSNTWKQDVFVLPSVLLPRSYPAGVLVDDSLYIFGGFVQALQAVTNDVWSYNITSKSWSLHSSNGRAGAPRPRQGHSAVFYNDTVNGPSIILFGGYNGTGGMSDTWQYIIKTTAWIQLTKDGDPSGPSPRWGQSAIFTVDPPTVVIFGGSFVGGNINPYYNDVWALQSVSNGWNWTLVLPDGNVEGPQRRGGHTSVVSLGRAFTFAGYAIFIGLLNDVWELLNF